MCGLAVAIPEGVLVEVRQPKGGWVFQRHGDQTLLEEVEALKVRVARPLVQSLFQYSRGLKLVGNRGKVW